jgi:hypothetical protein
VRRGGFSLSSPEGGEGWGEEAPMNSPAAESQGPIRTPLPNALPVRRGEGEATPRSLFALIQRPCRPAVLSFGMPHSPNNVQV